MVPVGDSSSIVQSPRSELQRFELPLLFGHVFITLFRPGCLDPILDMFFTRDRGGQSGASLKNGRKAGLRESKIR
jgi:hypothetical protein